jgi:hypothetical protein
MSQGHDRPPDEPIWKLVLQAAGVLDEGRGSNFRLQSLIALIQTTYPSCDRTSIQPIVQGMTVNAGEGPPSPCGKPLERVSHGVYRLREHHELMKVPPPTRRSVAPRVDPSPLITEDEVKGAVSEHLVAQGYEVTVAWGRTRGVDIDATKPDDRLLLEAKGAVSLQPQQVNYFLGAIGELVQRMGDARARFGLALPDNAQYRGLVRRLPAHARQTVVQVVLFIARDDRSFSVEWDSI